MPEVIKIQLVSVFGWSVILLRVEKTYAKLLKYKYLLLNSNTFHQRQNST